MTVLPSPYVLLRRDGEAKISHAPSPCRMPDLLAIPDRADIPEAIERRAGLLPKDLARLIADRNFTLAFQAVVRFSDRRPVSHEALFRLHPQAGVSQSTRSIVDAALDWGLGSALDLAVMDVALGTWPRNAATPVSVNVSARSLRDPVFFTTFLGRVSGEGAKVAVEISDLRDEAELPAIAALAPALRAAGVRVILDDFDAGAVALAAIKAARFDEVKFSAASVGAAVSGERGRRLLRALVALAEASDARTTAKLIETAPQAALMHELGVQCAQGWLFGAPALVSAVSA